MELSPRRLQISVVGQFAWNYFILFSMPRISELAGNASFGRVRSNYKIFIVTVLVPSEFPGSNTRNGCRREHRWLA
jgi:hypothetical protein